MEWGFALPAFLFAGFNFIVFLGFAFFNFFAAIWVFFNCRNRLNSNVAAFIWLCIVIIAPTLLGLIVYLLWRNRESFYRIFGRL